MCECILPKGRSVAHCASCHINFASDSLFDKHIRQNAAGTIHLDPREMTDRGHPLTFDRDRWRTTASRTLSYGPVSDERVSP